MKALSYKQQEALVAEAIKGFPASFGLKAFRGQVFTISKASSYYSSKGGVQLVLLTETGQDFLRTNPQELKGCVSR